MTVNGRYYTRPLHARNHINRQHVADDFEGRNEKFCAKEMATYFNCLQSNNNKIDACKDASNAIKRCMNVTLKEQSTSAKQVMTEKVPREQLVVEEILKEHNVTKYQPGVVGYMMDYVYCYLQTVLEDAKIYSEHANKRHVDLDDLQLAVNLTLDKTHNTVPSKEFLLKLAKDKNSQPLPPLPEGRCGVRLPPDRLCLTNATINIKTNQKAPEPTQPFRSYTSTYGIKQEPMQPPSAPSNPYSTFTQQFQETENVGFQQKHYGGQVYGKRKHDQMDIDDYDI